MNTKKLFAMFSLCFITLTMSLFAQQPYGGCWHPDYIKDWTPATDPDAKFNRSTVPLQARFYDDGIKANANQHYAGKVAACLTMNPMCSQTPSQGANNFIGYNPNEWQYLDMLVWWGGSAGEGIIIPPSAPVTDIAHLNGVKVLGNVFFPPEGFGGVAGWVYQMLTKEGNTYPYAKKLYEIAKYYGFDGWFLNEETVGGNHTEWANFIAYFYQCAAANGDTNMEIQWYDMGTSANDVSSILKTSPKTSFFANYGSANSTTISTNMSDIQSWGYTGEQAFLKLYSGVENAQGGLYGNKTGFDACFPSAGHKGSIQLFNPEEHIWKKVVEELLGTPNAQGSTAYEKMKSVFSKSAGFFVNAANDPTDISARSSSIWPGLANGIQERSAIQTKPFVTSFSMGLGKHRFVNGQKKDTQDWYHRGMQDILPTWRWWIDATDGGSKSDIKISPDWDDAYNVGTSMDISGTLKAGANYLTRLYKTKLPIVAGDKFELIYKTSHPGTMQLKLATTDNINTFVTFPITETSTKNGWSVATIDLSSLAGKTVVVIALNCTSPSAISGYKTKLGQMGIMAGSYAPVATPVVNLRSQNVLKEETSDIRLIWDMPTDAQNIHHFNVYLERNGVKRLVGQTRNEGFYISKFTRVAGEQNLKIYVSTVTKDLAEGGETSITMNYPAMGVPVVSLKASKTLIKIGEEITLTARANNEPTTYTWTTPANAVLVSQNGNQAVFKFTQEGLYDMKVQVTNVAGTTECQIQQYIEVSQSKVTENVAQGKSIHSSSGYLGSEAPENLLDGKEIPNDIHAKWCIGGQKNHWVIIDLQSIYKLYQLKIFDCGNKESSSDNFKNYKIELSQDATTWTEVLNEKGIPATAAYNTKNDWIKPTVARYIRFTPYDEEMPITIRIWEFQAFGSQGGMSLESKAEQSVNINTVTPLSFSYSLGGDAQESNFALDVVSSDPNIISIENKVQENAAVKFDAKAGAFSGNATITLTLTNGPYTKKSTMKIKVTDPSMLNILTHKTPIVIEEGNGTDEANDQNATTGPIGYKGITDDNMETWWSSQYIQSRPSIQTIKFDLGENYLLSTFIALFNNHEWLKGQEGMKVYVSTSGNTDADYTLAAEITSTDDKYEITPSSPVKARYLKFEIKSKAYYGFSLKELQAWGKQSVGLEDRPKKETFIIHPNPVRRGETLHLNTEVGSTIQIMSLQGEVLISETAKNEHTLINTQSIQTGMYLVVQKHNNSIQTAKLVIR